MKQSLRGVDNGKQDTMVNEAELKSTVTAEKPEKAGKEEPATGEKKKKRRVITRKVSTDLFICLVNEFSTVSIFRLLSCSF